MAQIQQLFPINIYMDVCTLDITQDVEHLLDLPLAKTSDDVIENYGYRSSSSYVLNDPKVSTLRNWIVDCLDEYAIQVLGYDIAGMGITQSWLSIKDNQQRHIAHKHPNSLISGVFYFDDHDTAITFTNQDNDFLMVKRNPEIAPYNQYHIQPTKYGLILFPSYMEHEVTVNDEQKRYSMSLNSIPLGGFGSMGDLTELKYNMVQGRMQ